MHGGRRPGSGRKPGMVYQEPRVKVSFTLSPQAAEAMREMARGEGLAVSLLLERLIMDYKQKKDGGMGQYMENAQIPRAARQNLLDLYRGAFGEDLGLLEEVLQVYVNSSQGHKKLEAKNIPVARLVEKFTQLPSKIFWRDGEFWIVSPADPDFMKFVEADLKRPG